MDDHDALGRSAAARTAAPRGGSAGPSAQARPHHGSERAAAAQARGFRLRSSVSHECAVAVRPAAAMRASRAPRRARCRRAVGYAAVAGARQGLQAAGQAALSGHVLRGRRPGHQRPPPRPSQPFTISWPSSTCGGGRPWPRLRDLPPDYDRGGNRAPPPAPGPASSGVPAAAAAAAAPSSARAARRRDRARRRCASSRWWSRTRARAEQADEHHEEHDPGQPEQDRADERQQLARATRALRPPGTPPPAPRGCRSVSSGTIDSRRIEIGGRL